MAVTPNSIITPQTPRLSVIQFSTADTPGTLKAFAQGASNGTKLTALYASNSDAGASHPLTLQIQRSGVNYGGVAVAVPASAGFSSASLPVNLMSTAIWPGLPIDANGIPYLLLQSTLDTLMATYGTTLTTGTVLNAHAAGGDF